MDCALLPPSLHAASLLGLAARRATGRLALGDRLLVLASGDVVDIAPGEGDESLEEVLVQTGRVHAAALARHKQAALRERRFVGELLVEQGELSDSELRHLRRAALVDRLTRALREVGVGDAPLAAFEAQAPALVRAPAIPLPALLLDALARACATNDAAVVGAHLNYRIDWAAGAHERAAREWADLGEVPQRPAVSTVLAKRPAAAARIAALLRAGLVRLVPPGRTTSTQPPAPGSVPEPAPRPPDVIESEPPPDPLANDERLRAPRQRLDPGVAQGEAESLEPTPLPKLPAPSIRLDDPASVLERRIAALESAAAPGAERARAFCELADQFRDGEGSLELACRAFREAAAADPSDAGVLQQAALHCHMIGHAELAARYASAAVAAASMPIERASAQRLRARLARSAGNIDVCIEALCEAAADDPACPDPHEQVAALLLERGQPEGANAHTRLAAMALQDDQPERAIALLAWAFALLPSDVPTAYEYASLLDVAGRRLGAVAILAEAANRIDAVEQKRKLRLSAAERAEGAGRLELAAELLIDAFDAEPQFDLVYGPLDEDLAAVGSSEYRAVVLEDVATACPDEQRAYWLRRAGLVMLEAEHQTEAALWLLFEALLTDGSERAALDALRSHAGAPRELTLLAHGLRAAIVHTLERDREQAGKLLSELAELAELRLHNPHLALAALQQLERLQVQSASASNAVIARLAERVQAQRAELELAERALQQATPETRADLCFRVATLVPDLPEYWSRQIQLLREALALGGADRTLSERLETLLGVSRDAIALATFLEDQAEQSSDREERVRLLSRLAAVHTVREDTKAVAQVSEALLVLDPHCRIAVARLERAARRLEDRPLLIRALSLRAERTPEGNPRARVLSQLARVEELETRFEHAVRHAAQALREDDRAADAGFLLLRHAQRIDAGTALVAVSTLRKVCGASRSQLMAQVQAGKASGQVSVQLEALDAWAALMPHDAVAHRARLLLCADTAGKDALVAVARSALGSIPSSEVLDAAGVALDRLEALREFEAAAELALRVAEEQGHPDLMLSRRALSLARRASKPALITRALDLTVAMAPDSERLSTLFELSEHQRVQRAFAAEIRTLHRVLEIDAQSTRALDRLHELLLQTGDATRLLAVDARILESERDAERRRSLLLLMCVVAAKNGDLDRAELHVHQLLTEPGNDTRQVRHALGVLLSIGEPRWALARCRAIADRCTDELGGMMYTWCALSAERLLDDRALALEIARAGTLRWPSSAEPLLLVERLSLAVKDVGAAIATYDALIAVASGPHGRRALMYRAGRWLERAGLTEVALQRYLTAFDASPTTGAAFKALERVARQTDQLALIVPCYERLAEHLAEPRARLLMLTRAAALCVETLGQGARGFDLLLRANLLSERFELDDRILELAGELSRAEPAAAAGALARYVEQLDERGKQLWSSEDKARCWLRLAQVCTLQSNPSAARAHIEAALALAASDELPTVVAEAQAALARLALPAPAPPAASARPNDEPSAAASLSSPARVESTASTVDARAELRHELSAEPWRTELLRELHALHANAGPSAETRVLQRILATFDPSVRAPAEGEFHAGLWPNGALRQAAGEGLPVDVERMLATLWGYARFVPRFRSTHLEHGVSERERITRVSFGPIADAYAQAVRMLDLPDIGVYVSTANATAARALPTHPPIVVAGRGVAKDGPTLVYGIARALWLARPEHIIAGVLPDKDASDLLEAAQIAFAPLARARTATASASAKELAAALWQSVPTSHQRPLIEFMRAEGAANLRHADLRARVQASTARISLLASGSFGAALRTLAAVEPALAGLTLSREQDFQTACRRCDALAETVRCALSPAYLSALDKVL